MKKVISIILISTFFTTFAFGQEVSCGAMYAVGIGHFLKGEARSVGDIEEFKLGESVEDEWIRVETKLVESKIKFSVFDKVADAEIQIQQIDGTDLFFTKVENVPVTEVPGFGESVFLFLVCGQ